MRTLQSSPRFIGVSAALFFGSAALTIAWCRPMSALDGMPMCSIRAPSASRLHGAATFLAMWLTMMVPMMLPSLLPMLLRYRQAVAATASRLDGLTALVAFGYFSVWALFGVFAFAGSLALSQMELRGYVMPVLSGSAMSFAGALQFTAWKARHLACCRGTPCCALPDQPDAAWRHGARLGIHCVHCCAGLTAVLVIIDMMDLRAMALVTIAISLERLAPSGLRAERFVGIVLIAAGVCLIARAASASFF